MYASTSHAAIRFPATCRPAHYYQPGAVLSLKDCAAYHRMACYSTHDVLAAPWLLEAATAPAVVELARSWIGAQPVVYSINAFWTFAGYHARSSTQLFHRDRDEADGRFMALFFYLTPFTVENGAAQSYVVGSHDPAGWAARVVSAGLTMDAVERPKNDAAHALLMSKLLVAHLTGEPGTAVAMLPSGLHCGGCPRGEDRLLAWVRFGVGENKAYRDDRLAPVKVLGRAATELTRLILA